MSVTIGIAVSEFLIVAVACYFILRYYSSPSVTLDVFLSVYLSWVLGFATVLLLPYDLSIALHNQATNPILGNIWSFVYWRSVFFLPPNNP
jgi:hypothetical protein